MKSVLILLITVQSLCVIAQEDSIFVGGAYRKYLVHTPPSYVPGSQLPMVIGFHGLAGWATQFENQSQLSAKADASNFIVVYPTGSGGVLTRSWNAGDCCSFAVANNIDDVGFVSALIDTLSVDYSIDPNRIYATGHSNGSMMSYRLACELPDKIAAIATVAGAYQMITPCTSSRPVPVIHFHSYLDSINPVLGGLSSVIPYPYFPPTDSALNMLANLGSCTVFYDTLYNGLDYDHISWHGCVCNYSHELYITHDGGHSWPGGMQTFGGDPVSAVLNANDLLWDFFQLHSLDCPPLSTENFSVLKSISVFPNPTSGKVEINSDMEIDAYMLMDAYGNVILSLEQKNIDLTTYPSGVYFLRLRTKAGSINFRIIKL